MDNYDKEYELAEKAYEEYEKEFLEEQKEFSAQSLFMETKTRLTRADGWFGEPEGNKEKSNYCSKCGIELEDHETYCHICYTKR